jgi:hypothetical protein
MRRTRMRYYTIDAENKEEFLKECEKTKSRLTKKIFEKSEIKESIPEDEEDNLGYQKKPKLSFHFNDSEDDSDLGAINNDDDEELLGIQYENDEVNNKKESNEEKGIDILVNFLKSSVVSESKNMDLNGNTIIFNKNKNIMSMSGNAIYDLNIRELVENILAEDGNEYIKSSEGNNNSLRDFIFQNIQSDSTLKIMVLSNNKNTKKSFMNKFFDVKDEPEEDKIYEEVETDEPFEIRKKQIKLFNKNIGLQMFDTSDEFHESSNLITSVYYKAVSAFFIFIESTNRNVKKYLDNIYEKISKYFINRTVVIFGVNMLFKEDCTIDGENLRDYANEKDILFIPINLNNFDLKYSIINNLFNLILIKGIDHKANLNSNRKGSRDKKLGGFKNNLTNKINNESNQKKNIYDITKMNVPSSLGYKKKYRIKHINAFDLDDKNERNSKRKLSMDI